jgi:hypothetical protein
MAHFLGLKTGIQIWEGKMKEKFSRNYNLEFNFGRKNEIKSFQENYNLGLKTKKIILGRENERKSFQENYNLEKQGCPLNICMKSS